ncbi:hypothetical protein V4S40_09470 [Enterococcus cecorum]
MKKNALFFISVVLLFSIGIHLEKWVAGDYSKLRLTDTVLATSLSKQKPASDSSTKDDENTLTLMTDENIELRHPLKRFEESSTQNFSWRNLEPAVLVDEKTNHFVLQSGKIYLYPNPKSPVYPNYKQYLHYMTISRQTVKSQGKLWYQVAFPDEVIGWVSEDQVVMHNEDYYFYQTGEIST